MRRGAGSDAPAPARPATVSLQAHDDPAADIRGGWGDREMFDTATVRRLRAAARERLRSI